MRRKLRHIGLQPSAPPEPEPTPVLDERSCDTCRFNRKASIYNGSHELIIHCSGRAGIGYTAKRTNCHAWEETVPHAIGALCGRCIHGTMHYDHPTHLVAVDCAQFTIQQIAYATECRYYMDEEMQTHARRAAEEEAMYELQPETPPSRYARVLHWVRLIWRGHD